VREESTWTGGRATAGEPKELTMTTWMWLNIPLMVVAFALTVGLSYLVVLTGRRNEAAAAAAPVRIAARQPADGQAAARRIAA
jgi:hypothetical protein